MKIIKKVCVFFLTFLLVGCGETTTPAETTQVPETTVVTEPEETTVATEPTQAADPIVTQEALEAALASSSRVVLDGDIQLQSGVELKNNTLCGNGYQLVGVPFDESNEMTRSSIFLVGGSVEDIVLSGGYCSIRTTSNYRILFDIRLKNVVSEATASPLYIGHGDDLHKLDAFDCEFYGKTVFSRISKAYFSDCTFGYNSDGSQGSVWAYRDATFVNCRFEGKEGAKFQFVIPKEENGRTVTFENCYVGDTLITKDNVNQLLNVNNQGSNTIRVIN